MASTDKSSATVVRTIDGAASLARLAAVDRRSVDGSTAAEIAEGCELLDVIEAGRVVGAVAVSIDGNVATLKAAATTGTETYEALGALEAAAKDAGAVLLGMFTRRGALVPLLVERGYRIRSIELEKDL
ncbi:hypothetical protein [Methylibium sp. Root1272]|uniref:hypothetical protein n=1 Tax=Methylibium sp. Root1272 TaxID=1736441 RepID=UPI0006F784DB|nr:hypothetical protein [Methylibium sp. Root1272]KQW76588.1 hypothetical protein ASC67_02750 [Methylibium sp. Root1272]